MERALQYLDDLDDIFGAFALVAERLRTLLRTLVILAMALGVLIAGVLLALTQPPLALACVSLLSVGILYRAVVNHRPPRALSAQ